MHFRSTSGGKQLKFSLAQSTNKSTGESNACELPEEVKYTRYERSPAPVAYERYDGHAVWIQASLFIWLPNELSQTHSQEKLTYVCRTHVLIREAPD